MRYTNWEMLRTLAIQMRIFFSGHLVIGAEWHCAVHCAPDNQTHKQLANGPTNANANERIQNFYKCSTINRKTRYCAHWLPGDAKWHSDTFARIDFWSTNSHKEHLVAKTMINLFTVQTTKLF